MSEEERVKRREGMKGGETQKRGNE